MGTYKMCPKLILETIQDFSKQKTPGKNEASRNTKKFKVVEIFKAATLKRFSANV